MGRREREREREREKSTIIPIHARSLWQETYYPKYSSFTLYGGGKILIAGESCFRFQIILILCTTSSWDIVS